MKVMDERILRERIAELIHTFSTLRPVDGSSGTEGLYAPGGDLMHLLSPVRPGRKIEDMLDQIRLEIRYLLLDLEATRRENRYLREMLEGKWNHGSSSEET